MVEQGTLLTSFLPNEQNQTTLSPEVKENLFFKPHIYKISRVTGQTPPIFLLNKHLLNT